MIKLSKDRRSSSRTRWQRRVLVTACSIAAAWAVHGCATTPSDGEIEQMTYKSPDAAASAFVSALQKQDSKALQAVFGPEVEDMLDSGDPVMDKRRRAKFVAAYKEAHELQWHDGTVVLCVGEDKWPFPVPIVKDPNGGDWRFDTEAGLDEILSRRIGQNELDVVEVCKAVVDAQAEYASLDRDGDGIAEYASKFLSDAGARNGLYWETQASEEPSPLGPLIAGAVAEGYSASDGPQPYHGYCYRMLTEQGEHAEGGAMSYLFNGQMVGGFAVVAYPAEYGSSGIMTFKVSRPGVVYEKDLGPETAKLATQMTVFDPGPGWERVEKNETRDMAAGK